MAGPSKSVPLQHLSHILQLIYDISGWKEYIHYIVDLMSSIYVTYNDSFFQAVLQRYSFMLKGSFKSILNWFKCAACKATQGKQCL